jgi:hypothetical protein
MVRTSVAPALDVDAAPRKLAEHNWQDGLFAFDECVLLEARHWHRSGLFERT